jgi:uncharacterized protein
MQSATSAKVEVAISSMRKLGGVIVALSGGVDSAVLVGLAVRALGAGRVLAVTGGSASLAPEEHDDARGVARFLGVEHRVVPTAEMDRPGYVANAGDRCYHCRSELFDVLERVSREVGIAAIAYGAIVDDLGDDRPGMTAAAERGVLAPLLEAGLGKAEIREIAAEMGLPVRDKPAAACLSSRIPVGSEVTPEKLAQIERAERALRGLGFRVFRVRHHGEIARIEIDERELHRIAEASLRVQVLRAVHEAGFRFVAVDLEGYRTGSVSAASAPTLYRIVPNRDGGQ